MALALSVCLFVWKCPGLQSDSLLAGVWTDWLDSQNPERHTEERQMDRAQEDRWACTTQIDTVVGSLYIEKIEKEGACGPLSPSALGGL